MSAVKTIGTGAIQLALAGAFIGLGVLGLGLVLLAVGLDGNLLTRLAVLIFGLGGVLIALGFLQTVRVTRSQ